jgi:hypothetical protein
MAEVKGFWGVLIHHQGIISPPIRDFAEFKRSCLQRLREVTSDKLIKGEQYIICNFAGHGHFLSFQVSRAGLFYDLSARETLVAFGAAIGG